MKTLQIGLEWLPERAGGLPRYFHDLIRAAPGHFEATGLVVGSAEVAKATGGRVRSFASPSASPPMRLMGARRAISAALLEEAPDLVASHFALSVLPALDRIRVPHVVHFHGPWAAEAMAEGQGASRRLAKRVAERTVYARADDLIVLSEAFGRVLREDYGVTAERIHVVPGGVDAARFDVAESRAEARERLGWPADRTILLTVRRLVRRMGLDVLIEATREVVRRRPDALLLIAGRGPLEAELQARIEAAGLTAHVRLIGFLSDESLPLAYRAADVGVTPSQALEGFGLVALECLAAGTPVVVTPVGGLPEAVGPLTTLVCENAGAGALAARIGAMLDSVERPSAAACRAHARAHDWDVIAGRVAEVYRAVLAR